MKLHIVDFLESKWYRNYVYVFCIWMVWSSVIIWDDYHVDDLKGQLFNLCLPNHVQVYDCDVFGGGHLSTLYVSIATDEKRSLIRKLFADGWILSNVSSNGKQKYISQDGKYKVDVFLDDSHISLCLNTAD